MEYLSISITPDTGGHWRAHINVRSSMRVVNGTPRTLHTGRPIELPALRGLEVGAVRGVLELALRDLGVIERWDADPAANPPL